MRWQSGGFIEIESVSSGREVSDFNQSPQMAITRAATTASTVAMAPTATQSIGRLLSHGNAAVRELRPALLHHLCVRAIVGGPLSLAALYMQFKCIVECVLCGWPIDLVDPHEVVIDLLNIKLTLGSGDGCTA